MSDNAQWCRRADDNNNQTPVPDMTTTETCSDSRLLRPHLQERLQQSQHYALTLLLAPAGCGKSTLLQQWATSPTAPDTVLLSLTEEDNDQVRLFNRLA